MIATTSLGESMADRMNEAPVARDPRIARAVRRLRWRRAFFRDAGPGDEFHIALQPSSGWSGWLVERDEHRRFETSLKIALRKSA